MKLHVDVGADILSSIDFPYPVVPIVRAPPRELGRHGYPRRLQGDDIPIGARILSVVDCFDALTSDRPYRPAMTDERGAGDLRDRRGTMYDPGIVDKFIEIHAALTALADAETPPVPAAADPEPGDAAASDPANADIEVLPHLVEAGLDDRRSGARAAHPSRAAAAVHDGGRLRATQGRRTA